MRLGIFGGTFDPIHLGHLRAAEEVAEEMEFEKVYMIPSALPPHKEGEPVAPFEHRVAMVKLSVQNSSRLDFLDLEGNRRGPSYSIDTLKELHKIFGLDSDFFFILGLDAFLEISTWKEHERLFDYANFVVIGRGEYNKSEFEACILDLNIGAVKKNVSYAYLLPSEKQIMLKETTRMDISSTRIRETVAARRTIRFLVPDSVNDYIQEKNLY